MNLINRLTNGLQKLFSEASLSTVLCDSYTCVLLTSNSISNLFFNSSKVKTAILIDSKLDRIKMQIKEGARDKQDE